MLRRNSSAQKDPEERAELEARLRTDEARRESAYAFITETAAQLKSVVGGLEPLAKHSFDRIDRIARSS